MSWTETLNLKFCFLNAENLFLLFDEAPAPEIVNSDEAKWQALSTSVYENKSLKKCQELARSLKDINADVVMLCEVGGFESLKNFNELFLNSAYSPVLTEGNSDRNIDVGFLIRKNLPFYFDLQSNKHRLINYLYPHERKSVENGFSLSNPKNPGTSHKFSRDVAELRLFKSDVEKPFLNILLTHLKSRLDPDGIDPGGFERRQAELRTLLEIYSEMSQKYPQVPILVAGDFNGNASSFNTDVEFKPLYEQTALKDVLDLGGLPPEKRSTYYQVRPTVRTEGRQIDFCFLSPALVPLLKPKSALIYRYKDEFGLDLGVPMTMEAKLKLPSDHYPIVFELSALKI